MKEVFRMSSKSMCYRPLFSHRNFMKTIVGYNISRFGDSIDAIVFSWLLYEVTGSAAMIALILAVNYLPTVLLQPSASGCIKCAPSSPAMRSASSPSPSQRRCTAWGC